MKKILLSLAIAALPLYSQAAATQESVEKLLEAMHTEKVINAMRPQMDNMMRAIFEKSFNEQKLSEEEKKDRQAYFNAYLEKVTPIMSKVLDWQSLKKTYVPIYQDTFTQQEIDGLIAFYTSPLGQSMSDKMPLVAQKSMAAMQERMMPITQELMKAANDTAEEFKKKKPAQAKSK